MEKNRQFSDPFFVRDSKYLEKYLNAHIRTYKAHEIIMPHHKENKPLAIVLTGLVYVCGENTALQKNIMSYALPGDFLSNDMLISLGGSVSYAITKKASTLAFFDYDALLRHSMANRDFADKALSHTLQGTERQMMLHTYILQQKTLRGKIIAYLSMEKERQNSSSLILPLPYSDLADYLCVDRSALMREIKKMKADNLISTSLHQLELTAPLF